MTTLSLFPADFDDGSEFYRAEYAAGRLAARRGLPSERDASPPWLDGWADYHRERDEHFDAAFEQLEREMRTP